MSFQDEYVEAVKKHVLELDTKLFPDDVMKAFEAEAEADIASGKNRCPCGAQTMERIYPVGHHLSNGWICPEDAQEMWNTGILRGAVVFNMSKERVALEPGDVSRDQLYGGPES